MLPSCLFPVVFAGLLVSVSAQLSTSSTTSGFVQATSSPGQPPTTNSTIKTSINLPSVISACSPSSWIYTAPVGPKYLGFFVSGTQTFVETFALPQAYDDKTEGSFVWNCDLPPGLSVAAMFYVIESGATGTNGHQTTTPDIQISAGTSGDQCYGQNDPGNQKSILSLASSLNPTYTFTAQNGSNGSSNGGNDSSTPVGAIVGGVLGGLALIIVLALSLIYLRKKHDQAAFANDGASVYSGWTEKTRDRRNSMRVGNHPGLPPPGTYFATDPEGNTILVMGQPPHPPASPPSQQSPFEAPSMNLNTSTTSPVLAQQPPRMTAPVGTLPEPASLFLSGTPLFSLLLALLGLYACSQSGTDGR
ncbi:EGFR-like transmembrane domain-containing protein [Sporobolomyces koalae]|uniref:EGFR-like transmembrane domain-containing protein n=1 Tax=Sporobolomyces koalae TaxID=500713 RepID=UPI0031826D07